jgi:hypothetical protein
MNPAIVALAKAIVEANDEIRWLHQQLDRAKKNKPKQKPKKPAKKMGF